MTKNSLILYLEGISKTLMKKINAMHGSLLHKLQEARMPNFIVILVMINLLAKHFQGIFSLPENLLLVCMLSKQIIGQHNCYQYLQNHVKIHIERFEIIEPRLIYAYSSIPNLCLPNF